MSGDEELGNKQELLEHSLERRNGVCSVLGFFFFSILEGLAQALPKFSGAGAPKRPHSNQMHITLLKGTSISF